MTEITNKLSTALADRNRKAVRRYGGRSGGTVSDALERLTSALAERYTIQEELGAGGMARMPVGRYGGMAVEAEAP